MPGQLHSSVPGHFVVPGLALAAALAELTSAAVDGSSVVAAETSVVGAGP